MEMRLAMAKQAASQAMDIIAIESDPRWPALIARDVSSDGAFVYAVSTTGIYCRPICPSKLAKPENVRFFATCQEAEAAGFRACQRCCPNGISQASQRAGLVTAACRKIEESEEPPNLESLACSVGLSPYHFHRLFKKVTGITPKAYGLALRARRVRTELTGVQGTVTQAIYGAGFNSNSRFYGVSNDMLGMTPSAFRAGGAGEVIKFAIGECSLGSILVACSEKGVCAICLGDDPQQLISELQDRFRKAELIGGDPLFERFMADIVSYVETPAQGLSLPLDIRGTAFQQRVWQALRDIPIGKTTNYAEIAARLGMPSASRAVAGACAANKIAVVIPCHRVVRRDGSLSGYRWGVERKRILLERERKSGVDVVRREISTHIK